MRVLVTRPVADAEPLVAALEARGHEALVEPLLIAEPLAGAEVDLSGVQALLFTSANGVRAFAALSEARALPVFAVGDATAEAAREAGFGAPQSAEGMVEDLARLVAARLAPGAGPLFHGAARQVAGDLKGLLERRGFQVRRAILYEARASDALSQDARRAIGAGLDAALFFSPRSAETFVRLVRAAGLSAALTGCRAVCLSQAVAAKLGALSWRGVHVASRPGRDDLLRGLDAALAAPEEVTIRP
jgi:uroporphyrinogen-III synthase